MQNWAIVIGWALGAACLVVVLIVWFRKQVFGMGGGVLSLIGVLLVGLSVFSSVKFKVGDLEAEFQILQEQIAQVADAGLEIGLQVENISRNVDASKAELNRLTSTLSRAGTLSQPQLGTIRAPAAERPTIDRGRIASAVEKLDPKHFQMKPR